MFAPAHHGATRFVVPVRKELAVRTIFNFLGPLTNPAGRDAPADRRLRPGLPRGDRRRARAARRASSALVVSSADGLDELSTAGATRVVEVDGGELRSYEVAPEDVGLERAALRGRRRRPAGGQRADDAADPRRRARSGARPRGAQRGRRDLRRRPRGRPRARGPGGRGGDRRRRAPRRRWTGSSSSRVSWRRLERAGPHRGGDARRGRAPPRDRAPLASWRPRSASGPRAARSRRR